MKKSNSHKPLCLFAILVFYFIYPQAKALDHSSFYLPYEQILKQFVVKSEQSTKVKYDALKKDSSLLYQFNKSISQVSMTDFKKFSEKEQIAFLINAYNSFTLQLIIENYPLRSIRDIGGLLTNAWKINFFDFLGEKSSLDKIEHSILRKNYNEPRIHFAVNCASIGCPPLSQTPLRADKLEEQLASAAKHFVQSSSFNFYDQKSNTINLSSIFKWYGSDFGDEKQLRSFIADHMVVTAKDRQSIIQNAKINYLDYDWNLNEAK